VQRRLVARAAELEAALAFVRSHAASPRALLVEGEAGIGKTTLWEAALAEAAGAGVRVLVARPAENEQRLPYAALGDLLEAAAEEHAHTLPAPQRQALDQAFQRAASTGPAERLAVGRAALALVRAQARTGPLLVAVDDVQWLDEASALALEFALRRSNDTDVRLLATRRSGDRPGAFEPERAVGRNAVRVLSLGPLGPSALDELVRRRLALRLARPALLRLAAVTGGNPYFALEIARELAEGGELAVPPSLGDALAARIAGLPPTTRDALLLAAASVKPSSDLVERAAPSAAGLRDALSRRLLEARGERLRFVHPLLASVTYGHALPGERRDAHRRLAAAAADPEERALHLARWLDGPDAPAAEELEAAAAAAAARGSTQHAAELAEASARLTPAHDDAAQRRRLAAAAGQHVAAGDPDRGRRILGEIVERLPPGGERAAMLWRLADTIGDSIEEPIRLCERALDEAGDDPARRAEIHTALGVFRWIAGDLEQATEHCLLAARHADEAGDETRLAIAIGEACHAQAIVGVPWDRDAMARALEIEKRVDGLPPSQRPSFQLAVISLVTDDLDTARGLLVAELDRVRRLGDEPGLFHALFRVAELELRAGDWAAALKAAREAVALTGQAGIDQERATTEMALALVLAHLGELDEARALAGSAHRTADAGGDRAVAVRSAGVLGFAELSAGDPEAALEWLTPAREELQRIGTGELSISGVVGNEIEALVATGRLEEAEAVAGFVAEKGRRSGRSWHRVVAARGRALVASARGDVSAGRTAIDEALAAHASLPQPFELGRTLLAAGTIERRAKAWAAARARLTEALETFDDLGAARWAELAASQLARLPGRRPRTGELSGTERQVAALAVEGLSNREIAARLFVTVRTVEANLSRVYARLGVRSRTELARRLAG
jgi:DNA-binding CsgD family transcriptional regulator